jgi:hypothetical protein
VTLIESHMAVSHLAHDSVSLSQPFSFHTRFLNFGLSLVTDFWNCSWAVTSDWLSHRLILCNIFCGQILESASVFLTRQHCGL